MAFGALANFLYPFISLITGFEVALPDIVWVNIAYDSALYALTLAAVMMVSLDRLQVVFTEDKTTFTAMDIRHRPVMDMLRFIKFGIFFCAARLALVLCFMLPVGISRMLSEHGVVDVELLTRIALDYSHHPLITLTIEILITALVLRFLFTQKYLHKRICLMQHA